MPPQLKTERLVLRPFTTDDFDTAYGVLEGHPDVWKFDPGFQRSREQRLSRNTSTPTILTPAAP